MRVNALLLEVEQVLAATDPRSLSQAATATAQLQEVEKQLKMLKSEPRVERARAYVREQSRRIKLASIESV
jgi:MoxR-like ATPase